MTVYKFYKYSVLHEAFVLGKVFRPNDDVSLYKSLPGSTHGRFRTVRGGSEEDTVHRRTSVLYQNRLKS